MKRARTSATQASAPVSLASAADYGPNSPVFLASYAPTLHCSRTSPDCCPAGTWLTAQADLFSCHGLEPFSETWPRSGMTVNGTAYRLPPLVRLTAATGGGGFATPTGKANQTGPGMMKHPSCSKLLADSSSHDGATTERQSLPAPQHKQWSTPTSRDYKDTGDCENVPINALLGREVGPSKAEGSLNPVWVCWLMGYPTDWLDCLDGPKIPIRTFRGSRRVSKTESTS